MDVKDDHRQLAEQGPDANWSVRVNANGSPSRKGQYFTRPTVSNNYSGTLTYTPDLKPEQYAAQQDANRRLLKQAMRIASQDETTRDLLIEGKAHRLQYAYDPVAVEKQGAAAVLDWNFYSTDKARQGRPSLWMHPYGSENHYALPLTRARTIAHETEHVAQNRAKFFPIGITTLASGMRCVLAQEAAARMKGALVALRFMVDQPGDNPRRWKPEGFERAFDSDPPSLKKAVDDAIPDLKRGDTAAAARRLFLSFYEDENAVSYYNRMTLGFYRTMLKNGLEEQKPGYFSTFMRKSEFSHDQIVGSLALGGKPYLNGLGVSLDEPKYTGLTSDSDVQSAYRSLNTELDVLRRQGYSPDCAIPQRQGSETRQRSLSETFGARRKLAKEATLSA